MYITQLTHSSNIITIVLYYFKFNPTMGITVMNVILGYASIKFKRDLLQQNEMSKLSGRQTKNYTDGTMHLICGVSCFTIISELFELNGRIGL